MLKYGRNEKMTICLFIGYERHKPVLCIFVFMMGVPPSNFVVVVFTKGLFLTSTTLYNATDFEWRKLQCCWFLIFGYNLLAEFKCGIELCIMNG